MGSDHPRGVSVGTLLKPAYAIYTYLLGSSFYPLDLALVIPCAAVLLAATAGGIWELWSQPSLLLLLLAWSVLPMLLVFGALDSLAPPGYTPPAAHHVAPSAYSLWLMIGALAKRPNGHCMIGYALFASTMGLTYFYFGTWSLNARKDFDVTIAAAQARAAGCQPGALLVVDGRMQGPAEVYIGDECQRRGTYSILEAPATDPSLDQVGLWFNASTSDTPTTVPAVQARLRSWGFALVDRWADHPVVVETYRRGADAVLADGQLALPWSVPPLQFSSLQLPMLAQAVPGTQLLGAVVMRVGGNTNWELQLTAKPKMDGLWLTTSTFNWTNTTVGHVEAVLADGTTLALQVSNREHTADWAATGCAECEPAFGWRKRLDALGRSAYPGAWSDFEARGFAYRWVWPERAEVKVLRFSLAPEAGAGQWWVWQVTPLYAP